MGVNSKTKKLNTDEHRSRRDFCRVKLREVRNAVQHTPIQHNTKKHVRTLFEVFSVAWFAERPASIGDIAV